MFLGEEGTLFGSKSLRKLKRRRGRNIKCLSLESSDGQTAAYTTSWVENTTASWRTKATRCRTAAAASRSPGPGGAAPRAPPRSYPGLAASAAVHTQTRWAAARSRGPRISAASAWANVESRGNSRAPRRVRLSTSSLIFSSLSGPWGLAV